MKISLNKKPFISEDWNYYSENYKLKATIKIPEDADAIEVLSAFHKAMIIDGYADESIVKAMKQFVYDWELENIKTLDIEE